MAETQLPEIGESVLYVPCAATHWNDKDHRGEPLFDFVFEDGPPLRSTLRKPAKGDPVTNWSELGALREYDPAKGVVLSASDHTIRPTAAKAPWQAVVVKHVFSESHEEQTILTQDGTEMRVLVPHRDERLALEVRHPNGFLTLYYPLEGQGAIAHGTAGHSWHREGEG